MKFQAARLRPVVLSRARLLVRTSLLWTAELPRTAIASVACVPELPRDEGTLRAALGAPPNVLVTLTEPITAHGPFGIRRRATRVALYVDEPGALCAALKR